jgi:hypothetical protein
MSTEEDEKKEFQTKNLKDLEKNVWVKQENTIEVEKYAPL